MHRSKNRNNCIKWEFPYAEWKLLLYLRAQPRNCYFASRWIPWFFGKSRRNRLQACMILLAKSIWCFYLVLIQCCSGLELLSQEEVIAQVSLELILLMPSSHQRAISSLLANGWKLSGFLWQFASLKIGRGQPWGQVQLHSWAPWRPMFWFAEDLGRKAWDQGLCWPWDRKILRTRPEFHQD